MFYNNKNEKYEKKLKIRLIFTNELNYCVCIVSIFVENNKI